MTKENKYTLEERVAGLEKALTYYAKHIERVESRCKDQWSPMTCNGGFKAFLKRLFRIDN